MIHLRTVLLAGFTFAATVASGQALPCRLALALALDTSSSVDQDERRLQLEGLATALEDGEVREAVLGLPGTAISFFVYEWSGQYDHRVLQDWIAVSEAWHLDGIAANLRKDWPRNANRPTALGTALEFGRKAFANVETCFEFKIDVSGDGRNNDGIPPENLYEWRDFDGITVNALVIGQETHGLTSYFENLVIRGPGAFVIEARDFEDYGRAMKEKLIREIGVPQMGMLEGQDARDRALSDFQDRRVVKR